MTSGPAVAEPIDPLIGTEIANRYRIVSRLGQGGMGVVYEGVHDTLGRTVAIKVLRPAYASDAEAVERFFREARTAAGLGHPNICDVYDLGRLPNERPYMVMPKLDGEDLAKLLDREGPQPLERVVDLLRGPASALDVVHKRGLVHRDIKPENLVLGRLEDGQEIVRVVDFGLATLSNGRNSRLTRDGFVCGTPEYMPPESTHGELPDGRGDVYSLAVVAYELIAGRLPIDDPNPMALLMLKHGAPPPLLSTVCDQRIPIEVDRVFERALAIRPDARHATAGELVRALADAAGVALPRTITPRHTARVPWQPLDDREADEGDPWPPRAKAERQMSETEPLLLERDRSVSGEVATPAIAPAAIDPTPFDPEWGASTDELPLRRPSRTGWIALALFALVASALVTVWLGGDDGDGSDAASNDAMAQDDRAREPVVVPTTTSPVEPSEPSPPVSPDLSEEPERSVSTPEVAIAPAGTHSAGRDRTRPRQVTADPTTPPERVPSTPRETGPSGTTGESAVRGQTDLPPLPEQDPARARELTQEATRALIGGRIPRAIELYRAATLAHPGHAPAWRGLGLSYEQLDQRADARRAFERYLRLAPEAPDASEIRARLRQ